MALIWRGPPKAARVAALSLIAILLGGCSGGGGEAKISGQVLIDGKPLRGGTVRFAPTAAGVPSTTAQIDESGNYGPVVVPEGEVMVSVDNRSLAPRPPRAPVPLPKNVNPEVRAKMMARNGTAAAPPPNPNYTPIPSRYYLGNASDLTFKVEHGEQKHDINLTSRP